MCFVLTDTHTHRCPAEKQICHAMTLCDFVTLQSMRQRAHAETVSFSGPRVVAGDAAASNPQNNDGSNQ